MIIGHWNLVIFAIMDYMTSAVSYAMLLIPTAIAATVVGQGVSKIKKKEANGKIILVTGIVFILLIPIVYFLFIHI